MNYALDLNNQRAKAALDKLGINKEELIVKTINDFGNKGTRDEIRQLRFEHYSRRLEETVKLVKDTMKTISTRSKTENGKSINDEGNSINTFAEKSTSNRGLFLNGKNKVTLLTALEEIKEKITNLDKSDRPKSMVQPRASNAVRFEQYKKNQLENISRIRENEENKVRKALSQSFRVTYQNQTPPKTREPKLTSATFKKPLNLSNPEIEIDEKLNKLEEKIERSRVLHEKQILMKKESARSQPSVNKLEEMNNDDLIFKIIERTRTVSERREKKIEEMKEKWEKVKSFKETKANRLKEIEKEYMKVIHEKEEELEKRLNAAAKTFKNKKACVGKEIEIRMELQKLKDEDANIKIKRAQRMM
ncbi:hypothetical protein SteCoe_14840 [Stentor coeruleus]|uniref:Uncharacterized protein n=1 Tax=Stentor coeruleus TaxID=5963 RepID=A0A1R2C533_9CILI|nr:hypothetical protein SteCoe_14840 [Stentor coeruleus]